MRISVSRGGHSWWSSLRLRHDEVLMPVLRRLRVFERCGRNWRK
ncbi:hypothetical protein ACIBU0_41415 [Streptomyces sp. NPDC049627]